MRCNFVDFYFALYGEGRPMRLIRNDAVPAYNTSLPRIPKLSDKVRSASPVEQKADVVLIDHSSADNRQAFKIESQSNADIEPMDIKVETSDRKVSQN